MPKRKDHETATTAHKVTMTVEEVLRIKTELKK